MTPTHDSPPGQYDWMDEPGDEPPKSCPFCGGEAIIVGPNSAFNIVACRKCGVGTGNYATKDDAIAKWNRRVVDDAEPYMRLQAAVRAAIDWYTPPNDSKPFPLRQLIEALGDLPSTTCVYNPDRVAVLKEPTDVSNLIPRLNQQADFHESCAIDQADLRTSNLLREAALEISRLSILAEEAGEEKAAHSQFGVGA